MSTVASYRPRLLPSARLTRLTEDEQLCYVSATRGHPRPVFPAAPSPCRSFLVCLPAPAPKLRPASRFLLDREAEPILVTRDISRLFLGMNLQCAQCHDHPLVEDYKQAHFYGIEAFLNRTSVFAGRGGQAVLAEKAEGEVS